MEKWEQKGRKLIETFKNTAGLLSKHSHKNIQAKVNSPVLCVCIAETAPQFCGYLKQMGRDLQGISTLKEKQSCYLVRSSELAMTAIRLLFLKTDVWYSCVGLLSEEVIFLPVYAVLITAGEIRTTAHHWVKIDYLPQLFPLPSLPWSSLQNSTDCHP